MSKIYFTLTGTNHYFGKEFLKKETIDEKKKEAKLQSFLLVYYNRTEDGEYYESARGKWAKKE